MTTRRKTARVRKKRTSRPVSGALDGLFDVPPARATADAEEYVCAVCARPLKRCLADPRWICTTKWKEGTVLQALRQAARSRPACLSCGRPLPAAVLRRNPLAEVCPSCRRKPSRTPHQRTKEQRHGQKARGA